MTDGQCEIMPSVVAGGDLTPAPGVAIPSLRTARRGLRPTPVRNQTRPSAHVEALVTPKCIMLILEDFDEIRAFLSRHFTQQGYDVFSSATLRDAIAIAWEEAPHIIIVDYDLSGETAEHAIERLHHAQPQSYIVLVGGPQTPEVEERAILAGASKVLSKSYGITEMDKIVENAAHVSVPQRACMRMS